MLGSGDNADPAGRAVSVPVWSKNALWTFSGDQAKLIGVRSFKGDKWDQGT